MSHVRTDIYWKIEEDLQNAEYRIQSSDTTGVARQRP